MLFSLFAVGLVTGVFFGMLTFSLLTANKFKVTIHDEDELIERLAKLEHRQWAHWTTYMMAHMTEENMARWRVQSATAYCNLSEADKEKDRKWARKVMEVLENENF